MKVVNQQLIKDANLKLLYNYIHSEDGISRTRLARLSHLSKTTVSTLVDELISRNFVYDSGTSASETVGRKPNSLHVKTSNYYVIDIVWINNTVDVYLIDITGRSIHEEHMVLGGHDSYMSLSSRSVYESILKLVPPESILGICVIVSAMIDIHNNDFYSTTLGISELDQSNIIKELKQVFRKFPIALLNDTACYAYAEKVYAKVTEADFAFINFGHGIGATLFIDNGMIGRAGGASTQFGHYSTDPNGRTCVCGNRGCLEATMGEPALKERAAKTGNSEFLNRLPQITFADLAQASKQGDAVAQQVIKSIARELANALSNLISVVNPKRIILGGKCKSLNSLFLNEIRAALSRTGFRRMVDNVQVSFSKLDYDAYLIGAMKYFFDTYYSFTEKKPDSFYIG
jgi:predicted NBD/HSP70 family sugar kinase